MFITKLVFVSIERALLIIIIFSLAFCGNEKKETRKIVTKQVYMLLGEKIVFPDELEIWINNENIPFNSFIKFINGIFKIILIVDIDCSPCAEQLINWCEYKNESDSILNKNLFLIIHTYNRDEFKYFVKKNSFKDVTVIYDKNRNFMIVNSIPENKLFHTMLLNKKNEIVLFGNPFINDEFKKLYISEINKIIKDFTLEIRY